MVDLKFHLQRQHCVVALVDQRARHGHDISGAGSRPNIFDDEGAGEGVVRADGLEETKFADPAPGDDAPVSEVAKRGEALEDSEGVDAAGDDTAENSYVLLIRCRYGRTGDPTTSGCGNAVRFTLVLSGSDIDIRGVRG